MLPTYLDKHRRDVLAPGRNDELLNASGDLHEAAATATGGVEAEQRQKPTTYVFSSVSILPRITKKQAEQRVDKLTLETPPDQKSRSTTGGREGSKAVDGGQTTLKQKAELFNP